MKNAAILVSLMLASVTAAQTQPAAPNAKPAPAAKAPESDVPACLTPTPRGDDGGKARQDEVLRRVREAKAPVNVVFVGDSITQGWEDAGAAAWNALWNVPPLSRFLRATSNATRLLLASVPFAVKLSSTPMAPLVGSACQSMISSQPAHVGPAPAYLMPCR